MYSLVCLLVYMFVYLFTCLFTCLHVCLLVYMFVYLFAVSETERLKREEMDKTLANKLQETGQAAGVQTWLSRELIGFNHTKNRSVLFLDLLTCVVPK